MFKRCINFRDGFRKEEQIKNAERMGKIRNAYRFLDRKPKGKRPLGWPACRWEDDVKMDLKGMGRDDVDWIQLYRVRNQWRALLNTVIKLRVT